MNFHPNELYVTTETDGLLLSTNIHSPTPTFSLVQSYPFRHPVRVFFNPYNDKEIWVSSFGAGMMTANLTSSGSGITGSETVQLNVYPNPSTGKVFVQNKNEDKFEIELMDLSGKLIIKDSGNEIDVHDLEPGVYLLRLRSGGSEFYRKLLKQ